MTGEIDAPPDSTTRREASYLPARTPWAAIGRGVGVATVVGVLGVACAGWSELITAGVALGLIGWSSLRGARREAGRTRGAVEVSVEGGDSPLPSGPGRLRAYQGGLELIRRLRTPWLFLGGLALVPLVVIVVLTGFAGGPTEYTGTAVVILIGLVMYAVRELQAQHVPASLVAPWASIARARRDHGRLHLVVRLGGDLAALAIDASPELLQAVQQALFEHDVEVDPGKPSTSLQAAVQGRCMR